MLDYILPRECHICGNKLVESNDSEDPYSEERFICTACHSRLPRTHYHRSVNNPMEQRFAGIVPFERASGHFFYTPNSEMAQLIHDFKYRKFPGLARHLGLIMGTELAITPFFGDAEYVMPIPLYFTKKAQRGYNQSEYIANGFAEATGLKISLDLRAIRPHKSQTSLSHQQRHDNTRGIFKLRNPDIYHGKHIIILDDVCTTGATLTSAAETILAEVPDVRISLLSMAVTF